MALTLLLDGVIAVLLAATIASCYILNRRLTALRGLRAEFAELMEAFNAATRRAETGVVRLRDASEQHGEALDQRIEAARALCDELGFLLERGNHLAERLAATPAGRAPAPAAPTPRHKASVAARAAVEAGVAADGTGEATAVPDDGTTRSSVERELARAVRASRQG